MLSSAFEVAYANWSGEPSPPRRPEIGPTKIAQEEIDRAFSEWEDVAFDQLADVALQEIEANVHAEVDFEEIPTKVDVVRRARGTAPPK